MGHTQPATEIDGVSEPALRELLERHGDVPTQRIAAALLVKEGCSKARIASALGVSLKTVYNWLDRFETRPVDEAPFDEPRSGAPGKIGPDERADLERALAGRPAEVGYDAQTWTPELVDRFVKEEFDVEYTRRHVRRLMRDVGARQ
ncbi:MAG: helix-turn-helix domain-containing protein [Halobacteriales archaeon]